MTMNRQSFEQFDDDETMTIRMMMMMMMMCVCNQILTQIAPVTWGQYNEPPPDIPSCGFTGELCPEPTPGL